MIIVCADDVILTVKSKEPDGIVISFNFDDSHAEYEVIIIDDEIKEVIYYSSTGEISEKVISFIDEAVELNNAEVRLFD